TFQVQLGEKVENLKRRIAESFGYPDPDVQFKTKILRDEEVLSEADIKDGDVIHVHTSRRLGPLTLKLSAE
ncbi:MAG: ubiquitin family protein, partial [Aigarchaeota archaeon]|nr:ubiquitin family protein [Aigarchaeota archaeon]